MSSAQKKADDLMRKASESFAAGKMQKAYKQYGQAALAYEDVPEAPQERRALAWYTRAMFILSGDATGNIEGDLDAGDRLVAATEFAGRDRFRGLFLYVRARWRRQHEDLAEAEDLLSQAEAALDSAGAPIDRLELIRERARLAIDRRDWEAAEKYARRGVDSAEDIKQAIESRVLLSEVFRSQDRMKDVLGVLDAAASAAYDAGLKEELWELQDRIKILKRNHPELADDI